MKPIPKAQPNVVEPVVVKIQPRVDANGDGSFSPVFHLDELILTALRRSSITALRVALGSIFLWFGSLKILGISPVTALIQETYSFLPFPLFLFVLGGWEMLIGIGMIVKRGLRCVLVLLGIHLIGTFVALCLNPRHFFVQGFPFFLTADGEFVMKNLVFMAAALVIAGHDIQPLRRTVKLPPQPIT